MLAELCTKSQITIPKEILKSLGLTEGDKLEVLEKDGVIFLIPVTVYPKNYIDNLLNEIRMLKEDIAIGKKSTFNNIDALFNKLENL